MKNASRKQKGSRLERWITERLQALNIKARRQPGSGIYSAYPQDVYAAIGPRPFLIEAKAWKEGWRTGDRALGKAELLVIKRDYGEPRVYMTWQTFERLVKAADGQPNDYQAEPRMPTDIGIGST